MPAEERDENLWRIAKKRATFRRHFYTYVVIIAFLWGIWWFTIGRSSGFRGYPWPIWVMFGWGIGLAFNYFDAYVHAVPERGEIHSMCYHLMPADLNSKDSVHQALTQANIDTT